MAPPVWVIPPEEADSRTVPVPAEMFCVSEKDVAHKVTSSSDVVMPAVVTVPTVSALVSRYAIAPSVAAAIVPTSFVPALRANDPPPGVPAELKSCRFVAKIVPVAACEASPASAFRLMVTVPPSALTVPSRVCRPMSSVSPTPELRVTLPVSDWTVATEGAPVITMLSPALNTTSPPVDRTVTPALTVTSSPAPAASVALAVIVPAAVVLTA